LPRWRLRAGWLWVVSRAGGAEAEAGAEAETGAEAEAEAEAEVDITNR